MHCRTKLLGLAIIAFFAFETVAAQPYAKAYLGFKASGLKGVFKLTQQGGGTQTGNVADASKTGFTFGVAGGYQIFPSSFASGWYKLDINLDASYTSLSYYQAAYDGQFGAGKFAASGQSGGSTSIISLDIMPIHRLTFPKFKLLSPYVGLGLGLNIMNTSDITVAQNGQNNTLTGNGEMKIGLLVFYGVLIRVSDVFQPYIQFKHMIPFGSETQFTQSFTQNNGQGGGTQTYQYAIQDVPGYFALTGGVRINF